MIQIEFSEQEIKALQQEKLSHPDVRIRRRMEAVYLKALGYAHQEIGQMVGISQKTLRDYLGRYQTGQLAGLKERSYYQPQSGLEPYRGQIEAEFKQRPAASMKEAAKRIEQVTGVRRSPDQVRRYLRRLGIKRLKAGQVPAKVNPQAQEDFLKKTLNRA
jgi:transposase